MKRFERKKIKTLNAFRQLLDGEFHNVHGERGAGKTTTACALATAAINDGRLVFSSRPIPGTFRITVKDLPTYLIPKNSLLILDEIGKDINARDWASTGAELLGFFQMCRHFDITVYAFGQLPNDIDCRIDALKGSMQKIIKCGWGNHCTKIITYDKYVDQSGIVKFTYPSLFTRLRSFKFDRRLFYSDFDSYDLGEYADKPSPDLVHWCISDEQRAIEEQEAATLRNTFSQHKVMQLLYALKDTEKQRKIVDKNFVNTEVELYNQIKHISNELVIDKSYGAIQRSLTTDMNACREIYYNIEKVFKFDDSSSSEDSNK